MTKKFPLNPAHPERLCWGCDNYCPADSMACGNGSERTQHPAELFGQDWFEWAARVAGAVDVAEEGGSGANSPAAACEPGASRS